MSKWNDIEYEGIIDKISLYLYDKYRDSSEEPVLDKISNNFKKIEQRRNVLKKEELKLISENESLINKFFQNEKKKLNPMTHPHQDPMSMPLDPMSMPLDPINEQKFLEDIILKFINDFFKKYEIISNLSKQNPKNDKEIAIKIQELKNEFGTDILKNKETISRGIITYPNRENRNKLRPILFKKIQNYKDYKKTKTQIESLNFFKENLKQELNQFIKFLQKKINIKIGKNTSLKMLKEAVNKYRKNDIFVSEILGDLEDLEKNGIKINSNYKKKIKLIEEEQKRKYYAQFYIYQSVLVNPVKNNTDFPEVYNFIKNLDDIYLRLGHIKTKIMSQYKPEVKPENKTQPEAKPESKNKTQPEAKPTNKTKTEPKTKPKPESKPKNQTKITITVKNQSESDSLKHKKDKKQKKKDQPLILPSSDNQSIHSSKSKKKGERRERYRSSEDNSFNQLYQQRRRTKDSHRYHHDHQKHQKRHRQHERRRPRQNFVYFADFDDHSSDDNNYPSRRRDKKRDKNQRPRKDHHRSHKKEKHHSYKPREKEKVPNSHFNLPRNQRQKMMNTQRPKNNKKNSVKPKIDETKITPFSELSKDEKILYVNTYLLYLFKDQIKNYKKIKLSQKELNNIEKSKKMIPMIVKDKNMKVKLNKIIVQSVMKITQDKYLSFVILESLTGKKYKFTSSLSKEEKSNLQKKYQQLIIDEEQLYIFINTILSKSKIILL